MNVIMIASAVNQDSSRSMEILLQPLLATGADQYRLELEFIGLADAASFDINADAATDPMAWAAGEGGTLAHDLDGSGTIDNGAEIFTPYFAGGSHESELAALAGLDGHGDWLIDIGDDVFASIWQDLERDGTSDTSELKNLQDYGIDEIDPSATTIDEKVDGQQFGDEGILDTIAETTGTVVEVALDAALGGASSQTPIGDTSDDTLAAGLASDTLRGGLGNDTQSSAA